MFDNSKIEIPKLKELKPHCNNRIFFYNKNNLFFNLGFFQINKIENLFIDERVDIVIKIIKNNSNREFFIIDATEPIYPYIENIKKFSEICGAYNKSVTIITGQNSKDIIDLYESFNLNVIFLPLFNFLFFKKEQIYSPFYKQNTLEKKFLTLNRGYKPFRKHLFDFLTIYNLLKFGEYSFLFENVASFNEDTDGEYNSYFGDSIIDKFEFNKKCFLNFVIETNNENYFIFENKKIITNFVSEKTAKCLYTGLPFILIGEINSLHHLKDYGIKTFDIFWDESYDLEFNNIDRINKSFNILKNICYEKNSVLREMYNQTEDIQKYNLELMDFILNDNLQILKQKINL